LVGGLQDWVSVFEQNGAAREKLMVSLLASFDARTWVSISGIVLRLVKGGGFGQARPSSPQPHMLVVWQIACSPHPHLKQSKIAPCSQRTVGCTPHRCRQHLGSATCQATCEAVLRSCCRAVYLQLPATAIEGSSLLFRSLLRDACVQHGPIFDAFLNRLFNTLNWTVTEFVVVLKVPLLAGAVCHTPTCNPP
jgi:hypothetical protein